MLLHIQMQRLASLHLKSTKLEAIGNTKLPLTQYLSSTQKALMIYVVNLAACRHQAMHDRQLEVHSDLPSSLLACSTRSS
jgi:hypothetical protein